VAELKQTGMSGCDALRKARTESPDKIAALQTLGAIGSKADDYEALVTAEIAGSAMPRHVAEQRLIQKYGPRLDAAQIRKSAAAADDFLAAVDEVVIAKRCSRTAAMAEVRKRLPALFARFQEV
jgi:hypothetical protein